MTNHGLKSYSLFKKGGALTEVVCSILAIFLLFTSWIWIESDTGIKESSPSVVSLLNKTGGPAVWFIFGVLLVNILLKYFKRSAWMSAICAFAFGVLVFQNVQSISVDFEMLGTHVTLSLWGYLAIFIEVIFVVSTLIGLFESLMNLKNFNRKTAKNYFLVALVGFIIIILSFFLMSKDVELAPVLFVVGQVLLIVFVLLGLVIRFFGKRKIELL